jgi:GAF domain-containing protein
MPAEAAAGADDVLRRLREALAASPGRRERIRRAVELLAAHNPLYHWTGVYMLEGGVLTLAHEVGRPTPHRTIPLDKGICGAAAREGRTVVVDDVAGDPRYLACSIETRSEIVVPIVSGGRVIGEIDVDSDAPAAFGDADRRLLERAAAVIAEALEEETSRAPAAPRASRPSRAPRRTVEP